LAAGGIPVKRYYRHVAAGALISLVLLVVGCGSSPTNPHGGAQRLTDIRYAIGIGNFANLDMAASAFLNATDQCIYDVRDRGLKYEKSGSCAALQALSAAYIAAGGQKHDGSEPTPIQLKAEQALKYAWMARAITGLGGGMQTLWVW
jgi:hypothetical protein